LRIGVALGLRFLLALLVNWPVKCVIISLGSTAVAIAGESEMQPTLICFRFSVRDTIKSRPLRGGVCRAMKE
jgi:hypothetical protein